MIQHPSTTNSYFIGVPASDGSRKPALFVDAGIHAREWIAPATALHFINRLTGDPALRPLLRAIDVYVLPSVNPDGYEYTRQVDRFWRKTRSPAAPRKGRKTGRFVSECFGVDPNRNFPEHWDVSGTSSATCSEIYSGPEPLSEKETQALAEFLASKKDSIVSWESLGWLRMLFQKTTTFSKVSIF